MEGMLAVTESFRFRVNVATSPKLQQAKAKVMIRFILKSAFWLMLAFLIMPRLFPETDTRPPSAHRQTAAENPARTDAIADLIGYGKTALEVGKLCQNNQTACETGTSLLASAGNGLMEASGRMLEFLSSYFTDRQQPAPKAENIPTNEHVITNRDKSHPLPLPREKSGH